MMKLRFAAAILVGLAAAAAAPGQSSTVRLGLMQLGEPVKWDLEANWAVFEKVFLENVGKGVDMVVTPECHLDGYAAAAQDWTAERFAAIAQDVESSPYIGRVRELAEKHKTGILFGFTEVEDGKYYNCALMIDRNGRIVGHYHKTHLQKHDLRFAPGVDLPVFETPWGKTGVVICADRRWPETARVVRLRGARLTLIPSYGMWHIDNEWWMRTRSYENENFLAFAHPNVAFVSDPTGQIVSKLQSNVPGMLITDIDLSEVTDVKHIVDRRPELYREITEPNQSRRPE